MKLPHFNKVYLVAGWVEGQSGRRSFAGKVVKSTNALGRGWWGGELDQWGRGSSSEEEGEGTGGEMGREGEA